jgi:serine protease Do
MRMTLKRAALAVLVLSVIGGAGTESQAQQFTRETPIVLAVKKTRESIVTIKVGRQGNWGQKDVVGTGVIVDARGYAITNSHVVAGSDRVRVILYDGTSVEGRVQVEDRHHDLAILRLSNPGKELKELRLSPGSDLMVGETIIAVGHPYGYTNTVSTGIISALGREITMPSGETLKNLIQTNASINPGNSGGPMLNINGELIGINVALREGAQGIAFALNADTVRDVLAKHLSAGKVSHVGHGLRCQEVVQPEGEARQQVVVAAVTANSPAESAGLQQGDVLVKVGERDVANRFDVERALWSYKPGDQVEAAIVRNGSRARVALRLAGEGERVTQAAHR